MYGYQLISSYFTPKTFKNQLKMGAKWLFRA